MTASDHLNVQQFMPVSDLLHTQSTDALIDRERATGIDFDKIPRDSRTTVAATYNARAAHMAENPAHWRQLDEPIRQGSIDPVVLSSDGSVAEGHHRIVRAHQLGVDRLPVTHDWIDSQRHEEQWKNPDLDAAIASYHQNRGNR